MRENNPLKRWPVASYFLLVFLFSWGGVLVFGLEGFSGAAAPALQDVVAMVVAMLGAPTAVGIAMTWATRGKAGLRDLFARMTRWKVAGRWYLALWVFPAGVLVVQLPLSMWVTPDLTPTFYQAGLMAGLFAGFLEEIGWMGFVYPTLRRRYSMLGATVSLGLIHAFWHTAADFLGNFNGMQEDWLPYFTAFFAFVIALRLIIVWIYENTQSVLLAQLAHAFSTGALSVLIPTANAGAIWPIFYAVYATALWLVAIVIFSRNRPMMTRHLLHPSASDGPLQTSRGHARVA